MLLKIGVEKNVNLINNKLKSIKLTKWIIVFIELCILTLTSYGFNVLCTVNKYIGIFAGIIIAIIVIITRSAFAKHFKAYKINKSNIKNKYLYHLLSKEKLNRILRNKEIYLTRTSNKNANYSTSGKDVIYFHSNLRSNSYFFNHYLKKKPDYLLIIPISQLTGEFYSRNIDKAIMLDSDYIGKAKIIDINRFNFDKNIPKKYYKYILLDFYYTTIHLMLMVSLSTIVLTIAYIYYSSL